jgi:hypothetical protein
MRVSNLRQNMDSKKTLRLIRGSTYTRVYTVNIFDNPQFDDPDYIFI